MSAPTIVRVEPTDDDGTGTTGTIFNKSWIDSVYAAIDTLAAALFSVAGGGTGVSTLAAHGVVIGNGTSAVAVTGAGTTGQVLTSNGASADPTFQSFNTVAATTSTGTQNDFAPGIVGTTLLRCANASGLTITGLAPGTNGEIVEIISVGAGTVTITDQDTGSALANRIITNRGTLILPAGAASVILVYDATGGSPTTSRWRVLTTRGIQEPQCLAWNSAAVSISNTTTTVLALDSEEYDTASMHDTVTNNSRVTVPTGMGGLYLVVGQTTWAANGVGLRRISLRKNGSTGLGESDQAPSSATRQTTHQVSVLKQLAAADYVELTCFQESGGALNSGDTASASGSAIMMIRLSA